MIALKSNHLCAGTLNMRFMHIKEAITRLKKQNKPIREIPQSLGMSKSGVSDGLLEQVMHCPTL